jgi:hypothetical protein
VPEIRVSVVRYGDPPPYPDLQDVVHLPDGVWDLAVLEGGMQSGKESLALRLTLPDGTEVLAETSLSAWITATCAIRGAFPDAFAGTPIAQDGWHRK